MEEWGKSMCQYWVDNDSTWEFQFPADWFSKINELNKFKVHYESWRLGVKDKQGYLFLFIAARP
jgi:hypothetical protein